MFCRFMIGAREVEQDGQNVRIGAVQVDLSELQLGGHADCDAPDKDLLRTKDFGERGGISSGKLLLKRGKGALQSSRQLRPLHEVIGRVRLLPSQFQCGTENQRQHRDRNRCDEKREALLVPNWIQAANCGTTLDCER